MSLANSEQRGHLWHCQQHRLQQPRNSFSSSVAFGAAAAAAAAAFFWSTSSDSIFARTSSTAAVSRSIAKKSASTRSNCSSDSPNDFKNCRVESVPAFVNVATAGVRRNESTCLNICGSRSTKMLSLLSRVVLSNPLSRLVSNLSKKQLLERSVDEVVTNSVPPTLTVKARVMHLLAGSKGQHHSSTPSSHSIHLSLSRSISCF